ncbi:hypothetical protein HY419_02110 [candidate division WWE3 bacterium]|nr:hypothetical protein [candidate division WWE3 bacterium]
MIEVIYGEDLVGIRDFIHDKKNALNGVLTEFTSSSVAVSSLLISYYSRGLFLSPVLLVLNITKDKSFDFEKFFAELGRKGVSDNHLMMVNEGALEKSHPLFKIKEKDLVRFKEYPLAEKSNVFSFLDMLFSKRKKEAFRELKLLTDSGEDEFKILAMVCYGVRNIAHHLYDSPELGNTSPYARKKASLRAANFDLNDVARIYSVLYLTDLDLKTGRTFADVALPLIIQKIAG